MKGDRQLNHGLDVQAETPGRRAVARQSAPEVFENFMSVKEMGSVEEIEAFLEVAVIWRDGDDGKALLVAPWRPAIYAFP